MKFDKPIKDLSRSEIESLLGEPEREDLEFKSELDRSKNGDRDPWYTDQKDVSERSKHDLAREIVAFANRSGGTLVLGILESKSKPSAAIAINPVPKPGELSERLLRSLHANIEPPLSQLNIVGVPTETDGSGVVVIEVGSSRSAPHRVRFKDFPKECYIRRNDECMPMDMRSIHDLVIERMRFATGVNELFRERSVDFRRFATDVDRQASVVTKDASMEKCGGFRITSAALESVMIADITSKTEYRIWHVDIPFNGSMKPKTTFKIRENEFRPVLRGWL